VSDLADFESPVLRAELREAVGWLWLERPEARNAMGAEFWNDLPRAVAAFADDPAVRVVVVAAAGPHFSVGLDLKEMAGLLGPGPRGTSTAARTRATRDQLARLQDAVTSVARCPKPVVAAVNGYCIGAGVDLIAACDIRLASADAVFSVREAKMAIVADLGSLQRLPAIVGAGHVAELALTGMDITAARAKEIGLVNDVADHVEGLHARAQALAAQIAANSPLAVEGTKAVLATNDGRTVAQGLEFVATWNAAMLAADDVAEALGAFMEKRAPKFTGR
jgi:enoyl-CoA hydratase